MSIKQQQPNNMTLKQYTFARLYFELGNATEAYRRAYPGTNYNEKVLGIRALEAVKHPKISAYLAEQGKKVAERHEITVDSLIQELEAVRAIAMTEKQLSAATTSIMGKAKMLGFLKDKVEHDFPSGGLAIKVEFVDSISDNTTD